MVVISSSTARHSLVPRPHPAHVSLAVIRAGVGFGSGTEAIHVMDGHVIGGCTHIPKNCVVRILFGGHFTDYASAKIMHVEFKLFCIVWTLCICAPGGLNYLPPGRPQFF